MCHLLILLGDLTFMGKYIVISNKTQRHTIYLHLETALHVSDGTSTHHQESITLSTASGICHTVTATCRYRERVGTCLSVLWVAYATRSTLKQQLPPGDNPTAVNKYYYYIRVYWNTVRSSPNCPH
jgi:hypothetical protein